MLVFFSHWCEMFLAYTVADNMFSIINMIIIIIWQYSTYSCECVKRLFISLIKANCICSVFYWGWGWALVTTKTGGETQLRVRLGNKLQTRELQTLIPVFVIQNIHGWFYQCNLFLWKRFKYPHLRSACSIIVHYVMKVLIATPKRLVDYRSCLL